MSGNYGDKFTADTGRSPSMSLWKSCPWDAMARGEVPGYVFFDDFLAFPNFSATDSDLYHGYGVYGDTGVTCGGLATEVGGVIEIAGNDADNDALVLRTGGSTGVMGKISDTAGENQELWFEARIRTASIADNGVSIFIGLAAEISLAATDTVQTTDTGVLKTTDYIGFRTLAADGDGMDAVHVTAGTEVVVLESAQTLVADTWYKFGLYFNGTATYWYVNGVQKTTSGGHTDGIGVLPAATNFPDGEEVAPMLATKVGAAAEVKVAMDWWKFAQRAAN